MYVVCVMFVWIRDREETKIVSHSQRTELLAAYLPNPSSVAKDLLPRVPASHCHLGNCCQGELPAGIADLIWLHSTATRCICGWTAHKNVEANPKKRLM